MVKRIEHCKQRIVVFCKKHKKIIAVITIAAVAVMIKKLLYSIGWITDNQLEKIPENINLSNNKELENPVKKIDIPDDFKLSGNCMTARALGLKTYCSDRKINTRIIEKGLAERRPNGNIELTELGKSFGVAKIKTTRHGHTFENIEWDEAIIDLIFSKEELNKIDERRRMIEEIMAKYHESHTA